MAGHETPSRDEQGEQHPLLAFADLMRVFRDGCSWKQAQTHTSLKRFLLEEAHEVLEAIDEGEESGDFSHLREELGDLLLQVYFHAAIAEERGEFTLADVARDVDAKMRRRNPHVIGPDARPGLSPAEVDALWQAAKASEPGRASTSAGAGAAAFTDGIPADLPGLMWASKVLGRLERAEVVLELPAAGDGGAPVGDRLLALVAEARARGVDAEQELRAAVRRQLPGRD